MKRQIEVSVDVFAALWSIRLPEENTEDQILSRVLKIEKKRLPLNIPIERKSEKVGDINGKSYQMPKSRKWTDVLIWTLQELGGKATLEQIYQKSRQGRIALGYQITKEHAASARECLESHCKDSEKYRGKSDLFYMPNGKGAGIWALRERPPS